MMKVRWANSVWQVIDRNGQIRGSYKSLRWALKRAVKLNEGGNAEDKA